MHRLVSSIPNWMKSYLSRKPEEKTWECATCGIMEPIMMFEGWYLRRRCPCEVRAEEQQRRKALPRTLKQAVAETQITQIYTWLGQRWREEDLEDKTFATFERIHQPNAYDQTLAFARNPQGTLALYGSYGVGKTHLLAAIANQCRQMCMPCLFASAVRLFDAIGERISADQDYHDLLKRAIATPLLLLDDIDKPKMSEFRQEIYYQIIDGRTRVGRPLVISANCAPMALERTLGGATRSRLMTGLLPVELQGMDYRVGMLS